MRKLALLFLSLNYQLYAYRIVSPVPFSVHRTEYIKFQITAEEGDPLPESVRFIVIGKKIGEIWDTLFFTAGNSYSYVFNCKTMVDNKFFLSASIKRGVDSVVIGREYNPKGIPFILDRNEKYSDKLHVSFFRNKKGEGETVFFCNNNRVSFNSSWDRDSLYLTVKVQDENINVVSDVGFLDGQYLRLWEMDGIEVSFDVLNDKKEFHNLDDKELLVAVDGRHIGYLWNDSVGIVMKWGKGSRVRVDVKGSVNINTDKDTGYVVWLSIPWSELGIQPAAELKLGFDIQNYDRDLSEDYAFRSSWSGVLRENNDNTSEWGTLLLRKKNIPAGVYGLLSFLVAISVFCLVIKKKRKTGIAADVSVPIRDIPVKEDEALRIREIKQYIAEHYDNPDLNREMIARYIRVAPSYLSTLFKKETGQGLNDYINHYRIQKAMELLKSSRYSISEIAFQVGFNTVKNFTRIFKEHFGCTPSEYREKEKPGI